MEHHKVGECKRAWKYGLEVYAVGRAFFEGKTRRQGIHVAHAKANRVIQKVIAQTPVCILKEESKHQTLLCTKTRRKRIWTGV